MENLLQHQGLQPNYILFQVTFQSVFENEYKISTIILFS